MRLRASVSPWLSSRFRRRGSSDGRPEGGGAEVMADAVEDFEAAHLPEPGEHFLAGQYILEEFQVFLQYLPALIEHDQREPAFTDKRLGFHFAQIGDHGLPPLRSVAPVIHAAFAKLVRHFHFKPKGLARLAENRGVEQPGRLRI